MSPACVVAHDVLVDRTTWADTTRGGQADPAGSPTPGRAAAAVLLLAVAVTASALAGPWRPAARVSPDERRPPPTPAATPRSDPTLTALEEMDVRPWDLTVLWLTLGALLSLAVLVLVLRYLVGRRLRGSSEPPDDLVPLAADTAAADSGPLPDLPTLRAGVADAGAELGSAEDPVDAVIAAWVALEEAADRSGVVRHPAWTPTEFTVTVLDRTPADRASTRTLLDLYLRARFGHEAMSQDDVAAARRSVARLAEDLAGGRPGEGRP